MALGAGQWLHEGCKNKAVEVSENGIFLVSMKTYVLSTRTCKKHVTGV